MIGIVEIACALFALALAYYAYTSFAPVSSKPSSQSSKQTKPTLVHTASSPEKALGTLHPMTIYFGSQSGTAETFSRELAEEAKIYGFAARVVDLEDFDEDVLKAEKYAVFLVSTFGEGEPTDNAISFCQWAKSEDRSSDDLTGVKYAVFGLGNRQYEHFCSVGRDVDERLEYMGASRVLPRGEGDDDGSLEDDFSQWKKTFWQKTNAEFGTEDSSELTAKAESKPFASVFTVNFLSGEPEKRARSTYVGGLTNFVADPKHRVVQATCVANQELRKYTGDGGSTRHLEFDLSKVHLPYLTADNLGVYPANDPAIVQQLIDRLGLDSTALFTLRGNGSKRSYLPSPCSIKDLFTHYLDITACPRLSQLPMFAHYTTDENEKAKLRSWCNEEQADFVNEHYTILELLQELPCIKVPLQDIADWCPKLAPRFYTISSSSLVQPKQLAITVSLVRHHKTRGREQLGICSNYLINLRPNEDKIICFVRPSSFRLPKYKAPAAPVSPQAMTAVEIVQPTNNAPPIIMIGPGTGIAPFRGFIQEARAVRAKGTASIGDMTLFFGCRESSKDFIYEDELKLAVEDRVLHRLHLAFSREPVSASEEKLLVEPNRQSSKVYVQDRLRWNGAQVWKDIHDLKAYVYICGGTAMGRAVREVILELARTEGHMTPTQGEEFIKQMQTQKRFIQELWS